MGNTLPSHVLIYSKETRCGKTKHKFSYTELLSLAPVTNLGNEKAKGYVANNLTKS